jgi:soluble lytic murein transglycosylase-like protein
MIERPLIQIISSIAESYELDPQLVLGLVDVESSGDRWAWNPEPRYRYFWNVRANLPFRSVSAAEIATEIPPSDFPSLAGDRDQEWWAQQASWGLMQIMGATARENGFSGRYLTQLCEIDLNLRIGCTILKNLKGWSKGDMARMLAAYNGGRRGNIVPPYRNVAYATKVINRSIRYA